MSVSRWKKSVIWLLALAMAVCVFSVPVPAHAAERLKADKKIVSLVFDDSGSMGAENRWVSANYALQAMAALMNKDDELYVTPMTKYKHSYEIDLKDPASAVYTIRKDYAHPDQGTPIQSVSTAYDRLMNLKGEEASTQYWLIVMTDGDFENGSIRDVLNSYKGTQMPNGSQIHIDYIRIAGDSSGPGNDVDQDPAGGLWAYGTSSEGITDTLSEVANQISGRLPVDSSDLETTDGRTLHVRLELPVFSIAVLSQKSEAKVSSCSDAKVERNISLKSPDGGELDLYGNASVIIGKKEFIPAGDYTLSFTEDISKENVNVMIEPAIDFLFRFTDENGNEADFGQIRSGDKVDLEIIPVVPGTEDPIDLAVLPEGTSFYTEYEADGQLVDHSDTTRMEDISLPEGLLKFRAGLKLPGYAAIEKETDEFEAADYGILVVQPEDPVEFNRGFLGRNSRSGDKVLFYITRNDVPMKADELRDKKIRVADVSVDRENVTGIILNHLGFRKADAKLKLNSDGSYELYPSCCFFLCFTTYAGDYRVLVETEGTGEALQAEGQFTVIPGIREWLGIIFILCILVLGFIIIRAITKDKFDGQIVVIDIYRLAGRSGVPAPGAWMDMTLDKYSLDILNPFRPCTRTFGDLTFIAGRGGVVYVTRQSIQGYHSFVKSAESVEETAAYLSGYFSDLEETEKAATNIAISSNPLLLRRTEYDQSLTFVYFDT